MFKTFFCNSLYFKIYTEVCKQHLTYFMPLISFDTPLSGMKWVNKRIYGVGAWNENDYRLKNNLLFTAVNHPFDELLQFSPSLEWHNY